MLTPPTNGFCQTDLSLYWSSDPTQPKDENLFDQQPLFGSLSSATPSYYPNLKSFQAADRKLEQMLNQHPEIYLQVILVPDGSTIQGGWTAMGQAYRRQMWETMMARWAAFPNVFWTVENDQDDKTDQARTLGDEAGCYFAENPDSSCIGTDYNPWRKNRPISFGHLRGAIDGMSGEPWHNYITAYGWADNSAQQMDGKLPIPAIPSNKPHRDLQAFKYADSTPAKPVLYVEDVYEKEFEADGVTLSADQITYPSYFYRRLFWSYLLSGSGVTYGAGSTWRAKATYSPASQVGLEGVQNVPGILADARVDLNLFRPQDDRVMRVTPPPPPTGAADTVEVNRPQVAVRDNAEMLVYNPNVKTPADRTWQEWTRRQSSVAYSRPELAINMKGFREGSYNATWYSVEKPNIKWNKIISYNGSGTLIVRAPEIEQTPEPYANDILLHLNARCVDSNKCLSMDASPMPSGVEQDGFRLDLSGVDGVTAIMNLDPVRARFGANSWRCDRPVGASESDYRYGCVLQYVFPSDRHFAEADVYLRRNSASAFHGFGIAAPVAAAQTGENWESLYYVWVGLNPEGDIFSEVYEKDSWKDLEVQHNPSPMFPLATDRWYHVKLRVEKSLIGSTSALKLQLFLDGANVYTRLLERASGDVFMRSILMNTSWWGAIPEVNSGIIAAPSVWWDEFSVNPPTESEQLGLYHARFQQALSGYTQIQATYFDGAAGYDGSPKLRVGANGYIKSLLRFGTAELPANVVLDEAILSLYYTGRSNGNTFTLGVHGVLADWDPVVANRTQRQMSINWNVAGMGPGADYIAVPAGTRNITGEGNAWVELDITGLAQQWVNDPTQNHGLVLLQEAASGFVIYDFCSELAQAPSTPQPSCTTGHEPRLTLRYHLVEPPPTKTILQNGMNGYTGNTATYFNTSAGYNNSASLRVNADNTSKSLLRWNLTTIPMTDTVAEATLRLYPITRTNTSRLTLAAHSVLAPWTDSQANRTQRQNGINWQIIGLGAGLDYTSEADGAAEVAGVGSGSVELDVTEMVRDWVANPTHNQGLVLLAQAASGNVDYGFCSELGWSPCTVSQRPILTIWHHPPAGRFE